MIAVQIIESCSGNKQALKHVSRSIEWMHQSKAHERVWIGSGMEQGRAECIVKFRLSVFPGRKRISHGGTGDE